MIDNSSYVVQAARVRFAMTSNLIQALNQYCWENGQDESSDFVDPAILDDFRQMFHTVGRQLAELDAAVDCNQSKEKEDYALENPLYRSNRDLEPISY